MATQVHTGICKFEMHSQNHNKLNGRTKLKSSGASFRTDMTMMKSERNSELTGTRHIITVSSKDIMRIKLLKAAPSEKAEFLSGN